MLEDENWADRILLLDVRDKTEFEISHIQVSWLVKSLVILV